MGKISYLQIELNKPIYMAGETITGSVSLGVVDRLKIRSVKFELHGDAYVHWSESHGTGNHRTTHHYSDTEKYIDLTLFFVAGQQPKSGDQYLEVGDYKYPFQLTLPPVLPSSFEVMHGYVRYWATARVDIPWSLDKYAKMAFTVINMMDLNTFPPAIRMPVGMSNMTQVGCCTKGLIDFDMNIPKAGYVPGEGIPFTVTINNKSALKCKNVRVKLTKKLYLHARTKTRSDWKEVAQVLMPRHIIPENTSDKWQGVLVIPPVVSSLPRHVCRIIEINYELSLVFSAGRMGFSYGVEIPIMIGYVPLTDPNSPSANMPTLAFQPSPANMQTKLTDSEAGVSLGSNYGTYQPMYPFYQGIATATPLDEPPAYAKAELDKQPK